MDYSVILNEISNNQSLILERLNNINDCVMMGTSILAVLLTYYFIRHIIGIR